MENDGTWKMMVYQFIHYGKKWVLIFHILLCHKLQMMGEYVGNHRLCGMYAAHVIAMRQHT